MITVFSMVIVFLTLLIISYLIKGLKSFSEKDKREKTDDKVSQPEKEKEIKKVKEYSDEELVAVIAAAIAASVGLDVSDIKINSIKRVSQNVPVWSKVGREERIFNNL